MANVEIVVVPKSIIHCKNNVFGSDWQKHEKRVPKDMCFSIESCFGSAGACTGAPRPLQTPQPVHNTKVSLEVVSYEVTRIATRSAFWEFATGATGAAGATEVVSSTVGRTPPPTHAGGQDDGSYTNSLK